MRDYRYEQGIPVSPIFSCAYIDDTPKKLWNQLAFIEPFKHTLRARTTGASLVILVYSFYTVRTNLNLGSETPDFVFGYSRYAITVQRS